MATEVRLTLPDDVAEFLLRMGDPSTFVADAVRRRMWGPIVRERLEAAGFNVTDEGVAAARVEMDRIRGNISPELRAKAAELYAEMMRRRSGRHA